MVTNNDLGDVIMKVGLFVGVAVASLGIAVGVSNVQPQSIHAVATVQSTPKAYRGSWFQYQDLQYRVKVTKSAFIFGGGYYAKQKWHPVDQQTYRISRTVKAGTCTWNQRANAQGYQTIKIKHGKFLVKLQQGILTVKQYRQGKDVNGYSLYFHQVKHPATVFSK